MSPTTFCYCCSQVKEAIMLECTKCKKLFHLGCLQTGKPSSLEGDAFFEFLCSVCSPTGGEEIKRMKLSWLQVVSLALYNLHLGGSGKRGYFRWKEHICAFIDKHWTALFGMTRKKTTTWHGTVAGTLSSGCPQYFRSGAQELKESGWWSAAEVKPPPIETEIKPKSTRPVRTPKLVESPTPKVEGLRTRRNKTSIQAAIEIKANRSTTMEAKDIRKKKAAEAAGSSPPAEPLLPMVFPQNTPTCIKTEPKSPVLSSPDTAEPPQVDSSVKSEGDSYDFDFIGPVKKEVMFSEQDLIPTERVPMLLLAGDKDMESDSDIEVDPCSITPTASPINMSSNPDIDDILASLGDHSRPYNHENISPANISDIAPSAVNEDSHFPTEFDSIMSDDQSPSVADLSDAEGERSDVSRKRKYDEEENDKTLEKFKPECVPLSLYEEKQLLKKLNSIGDVVFSRPELNRLRRKLMVRQIKRERGLPLFDLDAHVQHIIGLDEKKAKANMMQDAINRWNVYNVPSTQPATDIRVLDRFQCALPTIRTASSQKVTFHNRLVGFNDDQLQSICSPYTARMLKPFIRRDYESRPLKMRLLEEIRTYPHRNDPHWKPPPMPPIDYCYVRPEHIPSVNVLCREFFWPGIELSECLQYPDFSCVVLYRKVVIGFAFMVPDVKYNEAYISFLFTHPEWRFAGIAKFMVYHLIQTCMGKDVTLHVSATNPAMMLYQKFGFKPEEFILDFYEKYYPYDAKDCRHALFLRLRR
ncbi:cysteine-rich protein 2-binding protein-like [Lineus longissimus]|uniref:cysteine-rich protein 2-binding protein-like n=1 Tax=Lineus longissimus TaxID=88925 RepID=UPI002B4EBBF1